MLIFSDGAFIYPISYNKLDSRRDQSFYHQQGCSLHLEPTSPSLRGLDQLENVQKNCI